MQLLAETAHLIVDNVREGVDAYIYMNMGRTSAEIYLYICTCIHLWAARVVDIFLR